MSETQTTRPTAAENADIFLKKVDAAYEFDRLRRIEAAARDYYHHYVVDEAEQLDLCVCGDHQHFLAKALKEALGL